MLDQRRVDPPGVRAVGDQQLGAGVRHAVADPLVAVQHRHREQDRAALPGREERRRRLGRRRQQHRDAVALLDAALAQHARVAVRGRLDLAPAHLAHGAAEVLVDHRELVRRVLVADVGGDVVALGDVPGVLLDGFLVAARHPGSCTRKGLRDAGRAPLRRDAPRYQRSCPSARARASRSRRRRSRSASSSRTTTRSCPAATRRSSRARARRRRSRARARRRGPWPPASDPAAAQPMARRRLSSTPVRPRAGRTPRSQSTARPPTRRRARPRAARRRG